MANLLELLGMGATAATGAKAAQLEGQAIGDQKRQADLLAQIKQEQEAADRAQRAQMNAMQMRNIESQMREREAPTPITPKRQIVDGQIVDIDAGTAAPIRGFTPTVKEPTPKPRRTQVVDGQLVDLDTGVASPLQGYTPPPPKVTPGGLQLTAAQIEKLNTLDEVTSLARNTTLAMERAVGAGKNVTGRIGGVVPVPAWTRDQFGQGGEEGMSARNLLGNLVSTVGQMRSGGAISPQEFDRLEAFLPTANDDESVVAVKLKNFVATLENIRRIKLTNYQQFGKGGGGPETLDDDGGETVTTSSGRTFKAVNP